MNFVSYSQSQTILQSQGGEKISSEVIIGRGFPYLPLGGSTPARGEDEVYHCENLISLTACENTPNENMLNACENRPTDFI